MSELKKLYQPLNPTFDPNQKGWDDLENNNIYKNEIMRQESSKDRGKNI